MNDQPEDRLCPQPHRQDPDRPRRSSPRGALCAGHEAAIERVLSELGTFDADADEAIDAKTARHDSAPLTGTGEKPLPIDPRAADLRVDVRDALALWSRLVAEERNIQPPRTEQGSAALSAFLRKHHDWALGQGWVDDYATEILELGRRANNLLRPSGVRKFPVGECSEEGCNGILWAILLPADPYQPEYGASWLCNICNHEVPSSDWLSEARKIMAKREAA